MKRTVLLATVVLSGCGSMQYVMKTYGSVDKTEIDYEGNTYRIFDRKDMSKLMITPSIGQAIRGGAIKGVTFGSVNIQDDKIGFTNVATAYLQKVRPTEECEVQGGEMILDPQWEFAYLCNSKADGASKIALAPPAIDPSMKKSTQHVTKEQSNAAASLEPRTALVIGNANYKDAPLRTPGYDAAAFAQSLRRLNFEVTLVQEAKRREMVESIEAFGSKLRQRHGVALVFYAGHGMQVKGHNYLIPTDAEVKSETSAIADTVDMDLLLGTMAEAQTRINVIILDACRNNPYERRLRGNGKGLAQVSATETRGTLIAYSTEPGKTALDGEGRHSPYADALLQTVETPGLTIEQVFKQVRVKVEQATDEAQVPWESSSLTGEFQFKQ